MLKIDYDKSIVSLTNSILSHYGNETFHNTLPELDKVLSKNYKNVVLLILDGLGVNILNKHLDENSFLRTHLSDEISSVFPPTTVAATTSILTGKTPLEHGWLGWSLYFKEIDKCVDVFRNIESNTSNMAGEEDIATKYMPYKSILHTLSNKVRTCGVSPFLEYKADTLEGVSDTLKKLCEEDGKKFIYAYNHEPDSTMHRQGISAVDVNNIVNHHNSIIEDLASTLSDTLLIITADHGMTDIKAQAVEDYEQINNCLYRNLSMESRCLSFFVKKECLEAFPQYFNNKFKDKFVLYTHEEFLSSGMLGSGDEHYKTKDFVGDFVAVAVADVSVIYQNDKGEYKRFNAHHAGYSKEELTVPLIIIER